jgi:hypothetical protein
MAEEKESTSIPLSQAENGGEDPAKSPPGSPNSSTRKVRLFFNLHRPNTLFRFQLYTDLLDPASVNNFYLLCNFVKIGFTVNKKERKKID